MDEEERTVHILIGCRLCCRGNKVLSHWENKDHGFCLECGEPWVSATQCFRACGGEVYYG